MSRPVQTGPPSDECDAAVTLGVERDASVTLGRAGVPDDPSHTRPHANSPIGLDIGHPPGHQATQRSRRLGDDFL